MKNQTAKEIFEYIKFISKAFAFLPTPEFFLTSFLLRNLYNFLREKYFTDFFDGVVEDKFAVATLVLFSRIDSLIDPSLVLAYHKERKRKYPNLAIEKFDFENTQHVSHFSKHPELYINRIKQFLTFCDLPILSVKTDKSKIISKL